MFIDFEEKSKLFLKTIILHKMLFLLYLCSYSTSQTLSNVSHINVNFPEMKVELSACIIYSQQCKYAL